MPPALPPSRALDLPRRGQTWVYDSGPARGGPPLLLLHGWTSTAALNFYRCFPALTSEYRVVAMDHRGHGRGIRSRLPFRLEDCADDAAAVVEALELGPTTVLGYSMGGPVAQLMWRRHRASVAGLVLCATSASFEARQFNSPMARAALGAVSALSLVPSPVRRYGMSYATARWSAGGAAPWASEEWGRSDPTALLQAGAALSRFNSNPWIGDVDVPVAVVVTELDTTVSPHRQRKLAQSIPTARLFPVQGDHRVCVDAPEEFVPALMAACRFASRATV